MLLFCSSFSAIDPNETKEMLDYYQRHTGKPAYALLEENWGKDTSGIWIIPEYRQGLGDLNYDGVVNQSDSAIYNSLQPPFGWTVGGKTHWYRDCSYIVGKTVRAVEINGNLCIRCKARIAYESTTN